MRIIREKLSWQKGSVPFYQNQWLANDEAINFADNCSAMDHADEINDYVEYKLR